MSFVVLLLRREEEKKKKKDNVEYVYINAMKLPMLAP